MRTRLLIPILLLPVLSGCLIDRSTMNVPLAPDAVAALEPGSTTAREAVERLGAPVEVVQLGRRSAYRYEFTTSKRAALFLFVVNLIGRDTRSDRVWAFFDEQDVLTHLGSTFEGGDTRYALPWTKLHD